jgi:D-alanyl-lipoteichoic acid acyltransferase DltB (MBOAT superfamily)
MIFNSFDFAVFFPVFFVLYWFVFQKNLSQQNILIVAASYLFYGWWDWRFLGLLTLSSLVDYVVSLELGKRSAPAQRKVLLGVSIVVNLGLLGFFKYYNFFVESFIDAFTLFGAEFHAQTLNIVLPVGISFYTFQTMSYTIDVYRKELAPTRSFIDFSAFVAFFPQLVAGPIERASNLLPQFYTRRTFDVPKAIDGLRQILWGFFKKVVIADNCAEHANFIFNHSEEFSGSTLALGAVYFAFQIYGDFSGYSDIAIGTSRLLGFELKRNFHFPYFSRDIAEFWRRWHISLSTWFRDYVYLPLGGSRGSLSQTVRNVFVIFLISGFWHGANWTFVAWGALNALYFLPVLLAKSHRKHTDGVAEGRILPSIRELIAMGFTFALTCIAWIFFRAENIRHAWDILCEIASPSLLTLPRFAGSLKGLVCLALVVFFVGVEWWGRHGNFALERAATLKSKPVRYGLYYTLIGMVFWYVGKEQAFIYFQF